MKTFKFYNNLTFRVLVAILAGVLMGVFFPDAAKSMKPLGELFINMIKMVIVPVVFFTIVIGIGRIGGKAILYFEIITTLALVIGMFVAEIVKPGAGINTNAFVSMQTNQQKISGISQSAKELDWIQFVVHVVPGNIFEAFAKGEMLQVLFFAVLFGIAATRLPKESASVLSTFEKLQSILFQILNMVMKLAPIGAFAGMAYTIGSAGIEILLPLAKLMLTVYTTMAIFIFGVLGMVAWRYGFNIFKFIGYIKEEILLVLGTSSSESALPQIMVKLEKMGCSKQIVGLVIPTGYSFNLDGTSIYLSIAMIFLAQVFGIELDIYQKFTIMGILMLTSKGAAAVTGGGFIVLASTITAMGLIPIEGLALLLGVDRFMSEARAITNLIGNAVATVVIAKSEGEFIDDK